MDEFTEQDIAECVTRIQTDIGTKPGQLPQVMFGFLETSRMLGISPSFLPRLMDRYDIRWHELGGKRKGIPVRELAKLMLTTERQGAAA